MKTCKKCKIDKDIELFGKNKSNKDGLDHYCSICRHEYNNSRNYDRKGYFKIYKRKDKDAEKRKKYLKEYMKLYRAKNKESFKRYRRHDKIYSLLKAVLKYKKSKKERKTEELLGWTKADFFSKFFNIPEKYHIDHKIPVSWFLHSTPVSIINNLDNLQLKEGVLNQSKGNRYSDSVPESFLNLVKSYIKPKYKDLLTISS